MDLRTSLNELYHVIDRLIVLHGTLVDLLREEFAHMVGLDLKGLAEATHSKETIMGEIWNLENLRIHHVEAICGALKLGVENTTLQAIADLAPKAEGEKLRTMRTTLNLLVAQARELNAKNMAFAEESLDRIETMKRNALGINNTATKENYSNAGVRQPIGEQGGRLLSTEA